MDICKYKAIRSFMMAELSKSVLRNTHPKQQNQNQPAKKLKEEICFTSKVHCFLQ